eukprot:comp23535_c1_seq3/m.39644 comp23535_c1_seq3/g.39644  ORF comp23535_c1_seq3/g.39644 comp23535_c1_seq3/m.39644 type:complete len:219 (-) comp23535_c1_seq3:268-924(-)
MASAYGKYVAVPQPRPSPSFLLDRLPVSFVLANGDQVVVDRAGPADAPSLQAILNGEIEAGDSYPHEHVLDEEVFEAYFLSADAFVARAKDTGKVFGGFYVKSNFPGRCSHVANGGFIVSKDCRGLGVGRLLGACFLPLARDLGFQASLFNLVFVTNTPSVRVWDSLGFTRSGRVIKAGRLRGHPELVDAQQFSYDLTTVTQDTLAEKLQGTNIRLCE